MQISISPILAVLTSLYSTVLKISYFLNQYKSRISKGYIQLFVIFKKLDTKDIKNLRINLLIVNDPDEKQL